MLDRFRCLLARLGRWIPSLFGPLKSTLETQPEHAVQSEHAESLLSLLQQAMREGHTCLSWLALVERIARTPELRSLPEPVVRDALSTLQKQHRLHFTQSQIALVECVAAEQQIAAGLARLGSHLRPVQPCHFSSALTDATPPLSSEQCDAVQQLAQARIGILTGAPGTGKTATIKALVKVLRRARYRIELTAPTGRAALRLQEATGKPARTLHRFLRAHQVRRSSVWNWIFPAPKEAIIVDEASMLDTFLMARLVAVGTPQTKLLLVGDVDQLPSVGPGQVLRDLIASECVPVVRLTTNFRQAEGSQIIAAAEAIKAGNIPDLPAPGEANSDCYFLAAQSASEASQLIVKAVTRSLPARCGADPYQSIQILTPKHRGTLGTTMLNALIQEGLNEPVPPVLDVAPKQPAFAIGDRVLHIKNNYQLGVFNGECGSVQSINTNGNTNGNANGDEVTVQYGARLVRYSRWTLPQLTHGFAITIHRAQGSEYPFVVIPIHATQQPMLNRALLYTALTRARQMAVFIGSREAFAQAIANDESAMRQTGLQAKLQDCLRHSLPSISR